MSVQQEGSRNRGPPVHGIRHPSVSGTDSFSEDQSKYQEPKDGHPSRAPAL